MARAPAIYTKESRGKFTHQVFNAVPVIRGEGVGARQRERLPPLPARPGLPRIYPIIEGAPRSVRASSSVGNER
jgi:hypothetical protein